MQITVHSTRRIFIGRLTDIETEKAGIGIDYLLFYHTNI